jgi:hypothetical protein
MFCREVALSCTLVLNRDSVSSAPSIRTLFTLPNIVGLLARSTRGSEERTNNLRTTFSRVQTMEAMPETLRQRITIAK